MKKMYVEVGEDERGFRRHAELSEVAEGKYFYCTGGVLVYLSEETVARWEAAEGAWNKAMEEMMTVIKLARESGNAAVTAWENRKK